MEWTVEYYRDPEGNEPVAAFIDALPDKARVKVFRIIKLLRVWRSFKGYTKQIRGKIRELRIKDSQEL